MKILIDNGHGENTPGKRSPDGRLREYLYTREIAEEVVAELRRRGYDAERIVRENIDVSLSTRVRRINDVCKELGSALLSSRKIFFRTIVRMWSFSCRLQGDVLS